MVFPFVTGCRSRDVMAELQPAGSPGDVLELERLERRQGARDQPLALAVPSQCRGQPRGPRPGVSQGRVQRLGFNAIYQLDSEASLRANDKKGNLVLNYQGVGPFARSTTLKLRVTKPGYTTTTISDRIHVHH